MQNCLGRYADLTFDKMLRCGYYVGNCSILPAALRAHKFLPVIWARSEKPPDCGGFFVFTPAFWNK